MGRSLSGNRKGRVFEHPALMICPVSGDPVRGHQKPRTWAFIAPEFLGVDTVLSDTASYRRYSAFRLFPPVFWVPGCAGSCPNSSRAMLWTGLSGFFRLCRSCPNSSRAMLWTCLSGCHDPVAAFGYAVIFSGRFSFQLVGLGHLIGGRPCARAAHARATTSGISASPFR